MKANKEQEYESKIDELLSEYAEHRQEIKKMIIKLEEIKDKIDALIPTSLDKRLARLFEEKVKAMTNLFGTILEMRKEIGKSLKDEIEIRRKMTKMDDDFDLESNIDIRSISEKVEEFKRKRDEIKKKASENVGIEIPDGVDVPGINTKIIN